MGLLVSVVIPLYNAAPYLGAAIKSVLMQEHRPLEIIVADDGSTDHPETVLAEFGSQVRYTNGPNGGCGAARNRGIALAQGAVLAFLDADDLWTPRSLDVRLAALAARPELDAVLGHIVQFANRADGAEYESEPVPGSLMSSMIVRRESFFRVGLLDERWEVGEFVDWWLRAKDLNLQVETLPDVVLRRRLHGDNLVIRRREAYGDYLHILKASLDRRRSATATTIPTEQPE